MSYNRIRIIKIKNGFLFNEETVDDMIKTGDVYDCVETFIAPSIKFKGSARKYKKDPVFAGYKYYWKTKKFELEMVKNNDIDPDTNMLPIYVNMEGRYGISSGGFIDVNSLNVLMAVLNKDDWCDLREAAIELRDKNRSQHFNVAQVMVDNFKTTELDTRFNVQKF